MPRREKNNPKTIEQIHREAQEEEQQRQAAIQRASIEQRSTGGLAAGPRRPAGTHSQADGHTERQTDRPHTDTQAVIQRVSIEERQRQTDTSHRQSDSKGCL